MFNQRPRRKHKWSIYDVKLLEAYEMLEEQTCQYCGQPRWVCDSREDTNWLEFKSDIGFCKGKQAQDEWEKAEQKRQEKGKDGSLKPGQFIRFIPHADPGFYKEHQPDDRPDRKGWLKALNEGVEQVE